MINPTGYTALDLVGYTDRGTYSAVTNYVKNDLAHHNGIIWRCLIDDTIGITPVEGVNWTVFINAGSAAAEEIIAPIETSPSAAAHTSGTQLIYNDTLYDVIANISIGDSLTVGTNIQAAPKISSQISNLSTKITGKYVISIPSNSFEVLADGVKNYQTLMKEAIDSINTYLTAYQDRYVRIRGSRIGQTFLTIAGGGIYGMFNYTDLISALVFEISAVGDTATALREAMFSTTLANNYYRYSVNNGPITDVSTTVPTLNTKVGIYVDIYEKL